MLFFSRHAAKLAKILSGLRRSGFSREFHVHLREQFAAKAAPTDNIKTFARLAPWRDLK
jgi:hypothetical protein